MMPVFGNILVAFGELRSQGTGSLFVLNQHEPSGRSAESNRNPPNENFDARFFTVAPALDPFASANTQVSSRTAWGHTRVAFLFSRTAAMARMSEITQLAQSNQTRQVSGERSVFRNNPSPAVSALRMEALKTYSRILLA